MKYIFFIILILSSPIVIGGISFGFRTPMPPYMWSNEISSMSLNEKALKRKNISQLYEENLNQYVKWGGKWNIVILRQWIDTSNNIERIKKIVNEHKKRNVSVVFRLIPSPYVYGASGSKEKIKSSRIDYENWVRLIATTFSNDVGTYLIGNEEELNLKHRYAWFDDKIDKKFIAYEAYKATLKIASKIIHSIDSKAKVSNCGFSDMTLALTVAQHLKNTGGIDSALTFWNKWKDVGGRKLDNKRYLTRLLSKDRTNYRIQFLKKAIQEPVGSDLFQLHYYGGWEALPVIMDWLTSQMKDANKSREIIVAEIGFMTRVKKERVNNKLVKKLDKRFFNAHEHADNTTKSVLVLLSYGIESILYWSMRKQDNYGMAVRLFKSPQDKNDFSPNSAAYVLRTLSNNLDGLHLVGYKKEISLNIWKYKFSGLRNLSIFWSSNPVSIPVPCDVTNIIDIFGNKVEFGVDVPINNNPVLLINANDCNL